MNRISSIHNSPPGNSIPITGGNLLTPIQNGVRRSSGGYTANSIPNMDITPQTNGQPQNGPPSPRSPNANVDSWSSAIGHATTTGKSGRVIERLMAENDKMKRELKEQQTKADELQQRVQMCQPRIQALEAENGNLSHARDVDQALLARRDRQVADLKEELEKERQRRHGLEARGRDLQSERDEAVEGKRRDIATLTEQTRQAETQSNTMTKSFQQLRQSTQLQIAGTRREIDALLIAQRQDRDKLAKMDVVYDQMRQELERNKKINNDLINAWEGMRDAYRKSSAFMSREAKAETEKARKLSTEMDQVVNQMKWVMGIKKNTELDDGRPH